MLIFSCICDSIAFPILCSGIVVACTWWQVATKNQQKSPIRDLLSCFFHFALSIRNSKITEKRHCVTHTYDLHNIHEVCAAAQQSTFRYIVHILQRLRVTNSSDYTAAEYIFIQTLHRNTLHGQRVVWLVLHQTEPQTYSLQSLHLVVGSWMRDSQEYGWSTCGHNCSGTCYGGWSAGGKHMACQLE